MITGKHLKENWNCSKNNLKKDLYHFMAYKKLIEDCSGNNYALLILCSKKYANMIENV